MVEDHILIYLYLRESLAFGVLYMAFANGMHGTVLDRFNDILIISINSTSLSGDLNHNISMLYLCDA